MARATTGEDYLCIGLWEARCDFARERCVSYGDVAAAEVRETFEEALKAAGSHARPAMKGRTPTANQKPLFHGSHARPAMKGRTPTANQKPLFHLQELARPAINGRTPTICFSMNMNARVTTLHSQFAVSSRSLC